MGGRGGAATGAGIEYGKVKIYSADESLDKLKETLDHILGKHKYPEEEYEGGEDPDFGEDPDAPVDVKDVPETSPEESPWIAAKKKASGLDDD